MPENYARENTNRANNKKSAGASNYSNSSNNASNRSNSSNSASNRTGSNEASNKSPLSKQNAAQRKTEDCDR